MRGQGIMDRAVKTLESEQHRLLGRLEDLNKRADAVRHKLQRIDAALVALSEVKEAG